MSSVIKTSFSKLQQNLANHSKDSIVLPIFQSFIQEKNVGFFFHSKGHILYKDKG